MRLLISGSRINVNTLATFLTNGFDSSVTFEMLEFHDRFTRLIRSPFYKVLYRLFPVAIVRRMDRAFIRQVRDFKPDIVLVFKGMEISKWSLKQIKQQGIKLVNYNLDHPFFFENAGSGNRFVREAIPYYDLHITYSQVIRQQLEKQFNVRTALLPFGFELSEAEYDALPKEDKNMVCFVGNPDKTRAALIKYLADHGINVDVYGYKWDRYLTEGANIRLFGQVNGYDFWKTLARYRAQLNILRLQNENSHNMRTFEIPAAGGVMVAPDTEEHCAFFTPDEEVFLYSDHASCLSKCRMLLELPEESVEKIRNAARKRSVESGYSYAHRARQLMEILKSV